MIVPEPPSPPRYTNNSLHVTPTRHDVMHLLQPKEALTLTSAKRQQDFAQSWTVTEHRLTIANLTADSESDRKSEDESDSESDSDSDTDSEC